MSAPAASTTRGRVRSMRRAMSLRRNCSEHGSATAPSRQAPSIANTHSGRAPISVMTTSPRPTPARASAADAWPAAVATSANE